VCVAGVRGDGSVVASSELLPTGKVNARAARHPAEREARAGAPGVTVKDATVLTGDFEPTVRFCRSYRQPFEDRKITRSCTMCIVYIIKYIRGV